MSLARFECFKYIKSSKIHKSSRGRYHDIVHFTDEAPEAPRDEVSALSHTTPEDFKVFQQEQSG